MEQKEINERIALAMLKVCALLWEYCCISDYRSHQGEFSFTEVMQGIKRDSKEAKTGYVYISACECTNPKEFTEKIRKVDGVYSYHDDEAQVYMCFPTEAHDKHKGFYCDYQLRCGFTPFDICRKFCRKTGCSSLLKKAVFGYDDNGRWTRLPELKRHKPRKVKPKTIPQKPKAEMLGERLRAALLKLQAA